jgi:ABC-type nitrate/sulfonate/bicarbonate transport system substrate-binding protein
MLASSLTPLRVVVFDGGWNLPIWAAQKLGFFHAQGLDVVLSYTANSTDLVAGLFDGRYDVALAGADNFVAYREGAGEVDLADEADLILCMGGDRGFLSLLAAAGIDRVSGLRGRTIAVDAMTTGFAFVLRELLARHGVMEGAVRFERAGGTSARYDALIAGAFDATLLRTPFDLLAIEKGWQRLASADVLGPYQGTVAGVRRRWADANRAVLVGFLRAYRDGLAWCTQPANRLETEALLRAHVKDITPACAATAVTELVNPDTGLMRDMRVDHAGLQTVLELRRKYAPGSRAMSTVAALVDDSFLDAALRFA